MILVAGAVIQRVINEDAPVSSSLNVADLGTGYGVGVNAVGKAGVAIDGSYAGESTGQNGLLIDNVIHGGGITSTNGTAPSTMGGGGVVNDDYGVRAESEEGDGVFGWGPATR